MTTIQKSGESPRDAGQAQPFVRLSKRRRRIGFTLAEVMVGLGVFGLVIASVISTMLLSMHIMEDARNATHAGHILQSEMENLRRTDWNGISALKPDVKFAIDQRFIDQFGDRFTGHRAMHYVEPDLVEIRLTISWDRMRGGAVSRTYFTLVGKDGLNDFYYRSF